MLERTRPEGAFLSLIRAVLNDEKPEGLLPSVSVDDVMKVADSQNMAVLAYCGLNEVYALQACPELEEWRETVADRCAASISQMEELEQLSLFICGKGVKLLPLKGSVLKQIYPEPEYREMGDLDILYSGSEPKTIASLMNEFGYETESLEENHHDEFSKAPVLYVEMHRTLAARESERCFSAQELFGESEQDTQVPNLYHIRPEQLYIHVLSHAARHFRASGLGVRPVCDLYLLRRTYGGSWNEDYIRNKLDALGLRRFSERIGQLGDYWFGTTDAVFPEEEELFFFRGSVFGSRADDEMLFRAARKNRTRIGYLMSRLFVSKAGTMEEIYPILKNYPFLLPFMHIRRWAEVLIKRRKNLEKVVSNLESDNSTLFLFRKVMNDFGLSA